ncbi:MAG TPA: tryptophan--tRNA ligase [Candidatus Saccharimonadales bacterium]|nr:tryptophan--tRNA ligase [Candidatus Saccharimonadales bacterium]
MKRLVSGIKPTGDLHLGNYLGAIKQWVELQNDHDCFFFIADYHALTTRPKPEDLSRRTLELTAALMALGIDPRSSVLFAQSDVPEHAELSWILSNFVSMGALNRMTQYKEKKDQYGQNAGLYTYPILMAADIVIYGAEVVPVGEDQVQHLELAREIVRSVNSHTGKNTLVEPKPLLTKTARVMSLNNPEIKMSKSLPGGAIGILDTEEEIVRNIKRAVTDSDPAAPVKGKGLQNLFDILYDISAPETSAKLEKLYADGKLQYSELKEQLIEDILAFLGPVQKTYQSLIKDPELLRKTLRHGADKARPIAQELLRKIKTDVGLIN